MNVPKLRFKEFDGEWRLIKLGEHSTIKGRVGWKSLKQEEYTADGPYMVAGRYIKDGAIDWKSVDHIPQWRYDESPEIMLEIGDVIFTKDGSTLGNPALIKNLPGDSTINGTMMLVRTNNSVNSKFLYQILRGPQFEKLIHLKVSGSGIPHLFQADMKDFSFLAPSIKEQEKMSNFLEIMDKKIQLQQQKIDLLQEQKKGYMQKIFNQELRFEDGNVQDYQEWISEKLYHIAEINKGTQLNKNLLSKIRTTEQIYPVYNGGISPSGFTSVNNRVKDNIIISEGGNSCGYVNYIKEDFYSGGHSYTILLKNNEINKKFLYYYLKYKENHIMALRVGSGLPNIQKSALSNFDIHYPNISEQLRITEFLSIFEKKIQYEEIKVSKLIEQKKGFIQQMFI
ncbi:restriction endonuclease subunit S [Kurthia gibsonii]|uniref:Restriction endonuclease subunit S n=1 Tax=Kurthia gibsonii TaxID=33946 RepID=A0ABU9LLL5_9BACL